MPKRPKKSNLERKREKLASKVAGMSAQMTTLRQENASLLRECRKLRADRRGPRPLSVAELVAQL